MTLVLNKTQNLDAGMLIVEKEISDTCPFKVAVVFLYIEHR
jgi:hypothetical protein